MKYFSHKEGNENNLFFGLEMIGTAKKPFQVQGSSNVEKWKQEQESWRRKFAAVLSAPPLHKELELRFIGEGTRGEGKLKVIITLSGGLCAMQIVTNRFPMPQYSFQEPTLVLWPIPMATSLSG